MMKQTTIIILLLIQISISAYNIYDRKESEKKAVAIREEMIQNDSIANSERAIMKKNQDKYAKSLRNKLDSINEKK